MKCLFDVLALLGFALILLALGLDDYRNFYHRGRRR
jgi:hypothetical protein